MAELIFLKLGGSLITDKTGVEVVRGDTLTRLADEIARACSQNPALQLVLGHGSGSFGHVAGAKFATREGVRGPAAWHGYAVVSDAAARLNRHVVGALLASGVPAVSLQPSASAICAGGRIVQYAHEPVRRALEAGLLPVLFGDVAFDSVRGDTIISTEEVLMHLAKSIEPSWFLLAGETAGVLDENGRITPTISSHNFEQIAPAIGGSRGTDVTGGMASKVQAMLDFVQALSQAGVRIFSGLETDNVLRLLLNPELPIGTEIKSVK